ncbi:MAG: metal-dependent transcriptional regulator [Calditrichaceae bacterium]|nr:metal-dependent transcriptional regulator [Calditrichaceae bacterium]MBN2709709.1 metal-dependent transcriptional regulator [Calditrichaceae bacterium]RQV92544.1 MAG: metal-dependent transcriptional regulator [Calditrichota bacterium]
MNSFTKLTPSQEDYLKLIWYINDKNSKATAKRVSELYKVKPPTVLSMFQQLCKISLIDYNKSDGACLTDAGKQIALRLVRKHRLIESFLEKVLKLDGQLLHEEAERLEHVVSDQLMHHIDKYLDFPTVDPHGSSIPCLDIKIKKHVLKSLKTGLMFTIDELNLDTKAENYLTERKFKIGSVWELVDLSPGKSSFLLTNGKQFLSLSGKMAEGIIVIIK